MNKTRKKCKQCSLKTRKIRKTSFTGNGNGNGIGKLKKGELAKHGYHNIKMLSKHQRRKGLRSAVKEFGAPKLLRKLGAIRTYLKNVSPESSKLFHEDQRWIRKTYSNQFKSHYKNSRLYM